MFYLIEYGGGRLEVSYKDSGCFYVIGPFPTSEQTLGFIDVWDRDDSETSCATGFQVLEIEGEIRSEVISPKDRLQEEDWRWEFSEENPEDEISDKKIPVLDKWWPEWRDECRFVASA